MSNKENKVKKGIKKGIFDTPLVKSGKKTKAMEIGKKEYIDMQTGEVVEMTVIHKQIHTDYNFHKIWIQDLLNILNSFGNKKIKILSYLLSKMRNEDNSVTVTYEEIMKKLNISKVTISATIRELISANVIKKIASCNYQFNPALIVKGTSGKRQRLLVEYYHTDEVEKLDEFYDPEKVKKDLEENNKKEIEIKGEVINE